MSDQSTEPPSPAPAFAELGLRPELVAALKGLGYEEPTPIQREAIPPLLEGRDLLGQAATGTGKTAAFALPALQRLAPGRRVREPLALVLVPTRELAVQVAEAIGRYGRDLGARVLAIFGGQPIGAQMAALHRGVDVVVATPGRALDHLRRETMALDRVEVVVLDEADEMLDMGFADDIESVLDATPPDRQTVLFSATMAPRISGIAQRHLRQPVRIEIERASLEPGSAPQVDQRAYVVARTHKAATLGRVLDVEAPAATIVFCRTRDQVDELTEALNARGYRAEALHGGMGQDQRDRVMARLRNRTAELLVATDVAARGLDVEHLTHVVNHDVPSAPDAYVHRIGRVGRAGREGVAITLAEPRELRLLENIERATKQAITRAKVPTVADLRGRRAELAQARLRAVVEAGDLDAYRAVVEPLAEEHDLATVALAAAKLALEPTGAAAADDEEIPDAEIGRGPRRGKGDRPGKGARPADGPRLASADAVQLYVGAGRAAGVRPQDLVGAIAGETHLRGRDIGAIQIRDRFALVEVPAREADAVVEAMRHAKLKGKRVNIRREGSSAGGKGPSKHKGKPKPNSKP